MKLRQQNHVTYGLLMCAALTVCLALNEITGLNASLENKSPFQLFYTFIAPAIVWTLGLIAKKKAQDNKLTYKEGLKEAFKISLVYGIVSPFIFLFLYIFVNPSLVEIARTSYQLPSASTATVIIVDMIVQFIAAIIFGGIYGAIISLFIKTKS